MVDLSLIDKQFWELVQRYPTLRLEYRDGKNIVTGHLIFSANYQFQQINDDYLLEMVIPNNYPDSLPSVKDKANRIVGGFHKYIDGTLCLGASLALRLNYSKEPSLLGFIEKCVIPYLYTYSYTCKYGYLPYGELAHGWEGILDYYKDLFKTNDNQIILRLVKSLAQNQYMAHSRCPCGSRKKVRDCHGNLIKKLLSLQPKDDYLSDYQGMLIEANGNNYPRKG